MALLAAAVYDPSTAATADTDALHALTALDTTNLRVTFTAPSNGIVLVRLSGAVNSGTTLPTVLFGVLDGSTVKGRALAGGALNVANFNPTGKEASFLVTGLTPGNSYTWDAAYGVERVGTGSSSVEWGGPDNTTAKDAFGAFCFEVWETTNLLAGTCYDPATVVDKSVTALLAMTAFDTTNLRLTFTAPASGQVLWRIRCGGRWKGGNSIILLGVMDGSTVKARSAPMCGPTTSAPLSVEYTAYETSGIIVGLTPGNSYSFDAAYGVEVVGGAGSSIRYGGPDNATTEDALGGIAFEVWKA